MLLFLVVLVVVGVLVRLVVVGVMVWVGRGLAQVLVVGVALILLLQRGRQATAVITVPEDGVQVAALLRLVGGRLQGRQAL